MSSRNLDSKLIRFRPKEGIFDIICFFNKECTIIVKEILEFKYSIFIYLCIQNSYIQYHSLCGIVWFKCYHK